MPIKRMRIWPRVNPAALLMAAGLALVAIVALAPRAHAQASPADSLRISLDDAIARALAAGEEMQAAESNWKLAHALYVQARSTALPQLNLSTSYTRQIESIFGGAVPDIDMFEPDTLAPLEDRVRALEDAFPTAGLSGLGALFSNTSFASENTWVAALSLNQTIFRGGAVWNSIAAAKSALQAAEELRADQEREVVLAVREAYLGALLADWNVRIAKLALDQADSQLRRVRLRAEAGEASEFELLQAEVGRDNQGPVIKRAEASRDLGYLELARLANLPPDAPIALTDPILNGPAGDRAQGRALPGGPSSGGEGTRSSAARDSLASLPDLDALLARSQYSPGIVALENIVRAREHAVPIAAAGRWPALSLFASYSEQAYPGDFLPTRGDWLEDARAGVELSWSLFDGLRTGGAIQQAKAEAEQARQQLQQARERIRQAVVQSRLDLERAAADLAARSRTVELARRSYELASLRFDEGASDLLEVSDARIAFQLAQTFEAQARHDAFVALARLERYSGQPWFASSLARAGAGK
ncbi:MAG: TolC family protein [Candidatus Eisenbacteria bacterium]|nr:TolC family protein [Candidatus Eisenbacteria bacterium]